jgi:hypothetical protein
LYTPLAFKIRFFVIAPTIFCLLCYGWFFQRHKNNQSFYQSFMAQIQAKRERIKMRLVLVAAFIFLPWAVAWTSAFLSACAAQFSVEPIAQPFARSYRIETIDSWGGALWTRVFELDLRDSKTEESASLPLKRYLYEQHNWKPGEVLCARGRQSIFGTIVDDTSRDISECAS